MQSRGARIAVALAAVTAVVVLFVVLSGGGDDEETTTPAGTEAAETTEGPGGEATVDAEKDKPEPKPQPAVQRLEMRVKGGQPVGGVQSFDLDKGEKAELVVTSPDTTEHVHLHGYDEFADLAPGQPAKIPFTADIDGVFEIELEDTVTPLAELTVHP